MHLMHSNGNLSNVVTHGCHWSMLSSQPCVTCAVQADVLAVRLCGDALQQLHHCALAQWQKLQVLLSLPVTHYNNCGGPLPEQAIFSSSSSA